MKYFKSRKQTRYMIQSLCTVIITLLLQLTPELASGQWTKHLIDPSTQYTVFMEAFDIENDGDLDLFVTDESAGNILFYENDNNISYKAHN